MGCIKKELTGVRRFASELRVETQYFAAVQRTNAKLL